MIITIERTDEFTTVNGAPVRRWIGTTAGGIKCDVYVRVIRVRADTDNEAFERELLELPVLSVDIGPGDR